MPAPCCAPSSARRNGSGPTSRPNLSSTPPSQVYRWQISRELPGLFILLVHQSQILVLPCHELLDAGGGSKPRRQQGQRGRRRVSATARRRRRVAIEAGLCRSGRTGG